MSDSKMIELAGLWLNESQTTGKKYFSGNLGNARLLIFRNEHKKPGETTPDYRLYLAPRDKPQQEQQPAQIASAESQQDNSLSF